MKINNKLTLPLKNGGNFNIHSFTSFLSLSTPNLAKHLSLSCGGTKAAKLGEESHLGVERIKSVNTFRSRKQTCTEY